ncbi:MAG: hypothetical protein K6T54_06215 [Ignavibacterium sp.]|nr:hypothetical protein [Ignavibacterium sp.]
MDKIKKVLEVKGIIDEKRKLLINDPLPIKGPKNVKVLIILEDDDFDDEILYKNLSKNPAFSFLKESEEDIYSINDGKAFED